VADLVIDDSGPEPIYRQIADYIAGRIDAGELQPGMKLAAERDLAEEYGVAYLTVRRAIRLLRERGLIVTSVGRGNYVARRD
jgi:GntR family transcriptional regulator